MTSEHSERSSIALGLHDEASDGSDRLTDQQVDTLHYVADMAKELEAMAATSGCATLAGLFALAYEEATLRAGKGGASEAR